MILLRDGNGCVFPLLKDCIGGVKDPTWVVRCSFAFDALNLPSCFFLSVDSSLGGFQCQLYQWTSL